MAAPAPAPAPAAAPAPEKLNLRICSQGHEVYFTARKDRNFRKMFAKFAELCKLSDNALRFLFDGQRINPDHTPESLDMEDGDTIDAFIEMQGGGGGADASDDFDAASNDLLDAAWTAIVGLEKRNGVDNLSAQRVVGHALRNVLIILGVPEVVEPPRDQPDLRYERAQLLRIAAHQLRATPPMLLAYPPAAPLLPAPWRPAGASALQWPPPPTPPQPRRPPLT